MELTKFQEGSELKTLTIHDTGDGILILLLLPQDYVVREDGIEHEADETDHEKEGHHLAQGVFRPRNAVHDQKPRSDQELHPLLDQPGKEPNTLGLQRG